MFSESFDNVQNDKLKELEEHIWDDIDEKKEEKDRQEENTEDQSLFQEDSNENQATNIQNLENYINSKTGEYNWFFDSFPNDRHEDASQLSWWEKVQLFMASEIGWITEKKIKWFDRNIWDGKMAEVVESNWDVSIKITQELKDGNHKELSISLNNLNNTNNNQQWNNGTWNSSEIIQPIINISWDKSLLDDLLIWNTWNDNIVPWEMINQTITMQENPELFKTVFDCVNSQIINPEKEEFYGYVDHAKKIIDSEQFPEFLLQQDNWDNLERDSNYFVQYLLDTIEKSDVSEQDLIACKTLLSLCILLRNSSNNIQSIKETLWYDEEENIWKEKTIQWWENLIEFLPINENDLRKFMACRDEVIQLGIQELENEKVKFLSSWDAISSQDNPKIREIYRFLYCLNK